MSAARELMALVDEIADVRWTHPAWLALVGGTALLEGLARLAPRPLESDVYATYLSANGTPRSDTFMARDRLPPERSLPERIALAVFRARAAAAALSKLDGLLPEQPLWRALCFERGWLRRVAVDGGAAAAFITPRGRFIGQLDDANALARGLGAVCSGAPPGRVLTAIEPSSLAAAPAAIAVDLSPQPQPTARHLHRRAWTRGGGPWLGVGESHELELVTTCHLAVDGYGHGRIASEIFAAMDRIDPTEWDEVVASARSTLDGVAVSVSEAEAVVGATPLGFAGEVVKGDALVFARVAYAFGRTLELLHREHRPGRQAPTLQVTLAPGEKNDLERRRRRVRFALLALRVSGDSIEPFESFRARLGSLIERENLRPGLLMRVLAATATAPLPATLRRRLLSSEGKTSPWVPPIEVLGSRGSLSFMRFPHDECPPAPLYGLSAPGLVASPEDPFGSMVMTVIHHGSRCTFSIAGTGIAGDAAGARAVLSRFLDELSRVPTSR